MQMTLISRALDIGKRILDGRGVAMPQNLVIQADNTTREQRNQYSMMFIAWLTSRGIFRSAGEMFYEVGHTHNEVDQRFVLVRTALGRAQVLQTPEDSVCRGCGFELL